MLWQAGVDLVFTPTAEQIYPSGFQTWIEVEHVSQGLEGERRPGHFRGVATVVAKLFNLTQPQRAYFGQKDAQQAAVIKRMARNLNMPISIRVSDGSRGRWIGDEFTQCVFNARTANSSGSHTASFVGGEFCL